MNYQSTKNFVISTVGTSLLTKQINKSNLDEKDWMKDLINHANLTSENTPKKVIDIIDSLKVRVRENLSKQDLTSIRKSSAELNGIYGLYDNKIEQNKQDIHWLVATDTAQGQATAELVQEFLEQYNISVQILTPKELSAANTDVFRSAIDKILEWMDNTIPSYKESGYQIIFNLVGGFKSLQAYLNTIGMFYADEILYIFEGENSELIKIPQLPINIDYSQIKPVEFALMNAGLELKASDLVGVPQTLLFQVEEEFTLSTWGLLIWNKAKNELLSGEPLPFERIQYETSFIKDYNKVKNNSERIKLQETLAKASALLIKHNGNIAYLKEDGGILYEVYTNKKDIAHFRVTQGIRVSCICVEGKLILRHYGKEPDVNRNP
ncbi:MAG: CRISPR-associated protein [Microcoleaceae cyanobacterium]